MNDILEKKPFGKSKREKWCVIFLLLGVGIFFGSLFVPTIAAGPFLTYFGTVGSLFLLGANVDSYVKLNAAKESQKE